MDMASQWNCTRRVCCLLRIRCWNKVKRVKITKRDLKIFIPAFLTLFSSAYSLTMLFPFLPFMIQFLLPQVEEENIGKYAGFIAASLYLGRFFGSYVWGAVSDKKGRKPVVITSLLLMGFCTAVFGFSVQIYMAVIFRFLTGLFNGVVGTVKAIISESSSNTSQALSMSLVTCAFSLGLAIGPAVSGALADPISQYNLTISNAVVDGFLTRFPFSLPCILNAVLCVIAAMAVGFCMPETLKRRHSNKSSRKVSDRASNSSTRLSEDEQLLPEPSGDRDETQSPSGTPLFSITSNISLTEPSSHTDRNSEFHSEIRNNNDGNISTTDTSIEDMNTSSNTNNTSESSTTTQREVNNSNATVNPTSDGMTEKSKDGAKENDSVHSETRRARPQRISGRQSSLVAFFNRRPSFTPSYYKPAHVAGKKGVEQHYSRVHSRRHRLVFHEEGEEEEGKEEEDRSRGKKEHKLELDEEEVEGKRKKAGWTKQLGQTIWKTLLNLKLFLTTRATLLSLMIYCTFSFAMIGFDEVYSLWAAASPHLGGLRWTLHEIGVSLAVSGAMFLPFSFTLFPVMERRFGLTAAYQMNAIAVMTCMVILPIAHSISPDNLNVLRWFYIILVLFVIRFSAGSVFASTALFINNSVVFGKLGEVNGLAHSLTALLRTIAPVFSGTIFSLSVSRGARDVGFPVNYYLIFLLFGLTVFLCTVLGAGLPASINRQKVTSEEGEEDGEREPGEGEEEVEREDGERGELQEEEEVEEGRIEFSIKDGENHTSLEDGSDGTRV